MSGRPRPVEARRLTARRPGTDSGGRKLPDPAAVVALPPAVGVPDVPAALLVDGRRLWERVWTSGAVWLSPATDGTLVEQVCLLTDDLALARERYRATRDAGDLRVVVAAEKQLTSMLGALGFDPTSRGRLGVAEVKAASALDQLLDRRARRG